MRKKPSFWVMTAITLGVWISAVWIVQARRGMDPIPAGTRQPLQQACTASRADLRIQDITINTRGIGQPFDIRVEITNGSTGNNGLADTWSYLYVDRTPTGSPDVQAFAPTSRLATEASIAANFTVTSGYATVGWHTVSVVIDSTNTVPNEGCDGEKNNEGATSFEIATVQPPTPTNMPVPTPTPFPPPEIYYFEPTEETIGRGDVVTLRWQVSGESISVTLDDEPVPVEASIDKYPTESHVYTLRAENPGGVVQKTSRITVADPTVTPTPTEVPCDYPIVHEFGASPSSVIRGERVTVFWDVEGATEVLLNGDGVSDVSAKEFKINRTTTFRLVARNACGEVEEELTVQANYATATPTYTPTFTRTPTRTPTPTATRWPTSTPTRTPTRNVLPTYTTTPTSSASGTRTVTLTPTSTSSAFESPVGTPTGTVSVTPSVTTTPSVSATGTMTSTATLTPESTATPSPTWTATRLPTQTLTTTPTPTSTIVQATVTVDLGGPVSNVTPTLSPNVEPSRPLASPTAIPPAGSVRMYLCPLAVLLVFAIGVVILSIVVPRIQERQQAMDDFGYSAALYGVTAPNDQQQAQQEASVPGPGNDAALTETESAPGEIALAAGDPLLDDERPPEIASFDPLLNDLGFPEPEETERAPSTSEEQS